MKNLYSKNIKSVLLAIIIILNFSTHNKLMAQVQDSTLQLQDTILVVPDSIIQDSQSPQGGIIGPMAICPATYLSPSSVSAPASGGTYPISVTTLNNCSTYAVSESLTWVSYTKSGFTVTLYVSYNSGPARSGDVSIGGEILIVSQACGDYPGTAGSISGPGSVCRGQSGVSFSVSAISGATGYLWSLPYGATIVSGDNTNWIVVNFSSGANSGTVSVRGTNSCSQGNPSYLSLTVNNLPTPSASSNSPACYNGTLYLYGSGGTSYQWNGPNSFSSSQQNPAIGGVTQANQGSYYVTVTDGNGCSAQAVTDVGIYSPLYAGISGGTTPICHNTSPGTFTATPGVGSYTYLWYRNGASTGVTSQSYNPGALTSSSSFYCAVTSGSCGTINTSTISISVYGSLGASISGGTSPVCYNSSPGTFTATGSGGTGSYSYLWYRNGSSTGVTSQSYNPGALTSNTSFYCAVTSGSCGTVNTSTVSISVYGNLGASISGGSSPICYNTSPGTFTASGSGGTGSYTYLWYRNGASTGVTTQSYNPGTLTSNSTFFCAVTSGSCGTVNSSTVSISVYGNLNASISGGTSPVCYNTSPGTFTATGSGATGSYTYLWYKNGASTGVTSQTYIPGALTTNSTVYCAVTSGSCGTVNTSTVSITVYANLGASISGGTSPICINTSPGTFTATGSGATGSYTFLWYKNGASTGVTTQTYNPGALTANSTFYCAVTSGSCGTVNTSTISITVNPLAAVSDQPVNSTITSDQDAAFSLTASGVNLHYQWQFSNNSGPWTNIPGDNPGTTVTNNYIFDPKIYRCIVNSDCGSATSNSVKIIVNTYYMDESEVPSINRPLDTLKAVGSTAISASVSQMGAANFEIPIFASPGTNGMTPSISIFYSSQSGNGVLGYGMHLGGISSIQRTGKTLYYDNENSPVKFTADDRFVINGERLLISGTYGTSDSVYFAETNPFSKITAFESTGNGPAWFKQETKEGITYEYGNSGTSKHFAANVNSTVYAWYLSKMYDNNGNFIRYNYSSQNGEIWLRSIEYTGNNQYPLTPYDSLTFTYTDRTVDKTLINVGQGYIPKTKLLHEINVYCEGAKVRRYKFNYTNGFYSQLVSIEEYGKNDVTYNPVVIDWGNEGTFYAHSEPYISRFDTDNGVVTGDFNGDGKEEVAYMASDSLGSYLAVYKIDDFQGIFTETFDPDFFSPYPKQFSSSSNGDIDGDGIDDLIITSTDSLFIFYGDQSESQMFSRRSSETYSGHLGYYSADLNGDGIGEIVAMNTGKKLVNFDGDSRTDIITFSTDGYELTTSNSASGIISSSVLRLANISKIFDGDFNGDSQTDLLVSSGGSWQIWDYNGIQYNVNTSYSVPLGTFDPTTSGNAMFVRDINNDGKSDIIKITTHYHLSTPDSLIWTCYLSKGLNFQSEIRKFASDYQANMGDFLFGNFYGNGQMECFYRLSDIIELKNNDRINLVSSVINGLNYKTNFSYAYNVIPSATLTRPDLDSLKYVPLSQFVVSSITSVGSDDSLKTVEYSYANPIIHIGGKGILGYANQTIKNNVTGFSNTTKMGVNEDLFYTYPSIQTVKDSLNNTISEQYFTNSNKTYTNGSYFSYMSQVISRDLIKNFRDTASYYYDSYGNDTLTIVSQNGEMVTETSNEFVQKGSWCPARVSSSNVIRKSFNGNPPYETNSQFFYDDRGRLIRNRIFANLSDSLSTRITYNNFGNITQKRFKTGNAVARYESYQFDASQRFATTVTTGSLASSYVYDPSTGSVDTVSAPNGVVTTYLYDGFGRQTEQRFTQDRYLTTSYDWSINDPQKAIYKVTQSDAFADNVTWYDNEGKQLRAGSRSFDGTNIYVDKQYSNKGELSRVSRPFPGSAASVWNTNTYDNLGRLSTSSANGASVSYSYTNNQTTTTLNVPGANRTKTVTQNGLGQVSSVTRNNIDLGFEYDNKGRLTGVTPPVSGSEVGYGYDSRALLSQESDPDRGTSGYRHNSFGELVNYENANGDVDSIIYDHMGRDSIRIRNNVNTTYTYYTSGPGKGRVSQVASSGRYKKYTYNTYGNVTRECDSISATEYFPYTYQYNNYGQLTSMTYPGGFSVTYHYNSNGYLQEIRRADDSSPIWSCVNVDNEGNITQYKLSGENIIVDKSFNGYGYLKEIKTTAATVKQWLTYSFDEKTGDLKLRRDTLRNLSEEFVYDTFDQLLWSKVTNQDTLRMEYDDLGNITHKSDVGDYYYNSERVHAVDSISGSQNLNRQNIEYNNFNKPVFIANDSDSLVYQYNVMDDRIKAIFYDTAGLKKTIWYSGQYERALAGDSTTHYNYIYGPDGPIALARQTPSGTIIYYICKDHLGSITGIMNSSGVMLEEYNYDPWGKRRNPADWSYTNVSTPVYTQHGFTGHEHLDMFELINMNGRIYDSEIARFLNPDPVIQDPYNLMNYNRYTYCLNNPVKYTDPSGYAYDYKRFLQEAIEVGPDTQFFNNYPSGWGNGSPRYSQRGGYGSPGYGLNGTGLNGVYYDWYSSAYRSTMEGNPEVGWSYANSVVSQHGTSYKYGIIGGHSSGAYVRGLYSNERGVKSIVLDYDPGAEEAVDWYVHLGSWTLGIPQGREVWLDEVSNYTALAGIGMEALNGVAKSSANYTPKYAYRGMAQIEATGAKTLGKVAKVARFSGVAASVFTTGYSTFKVVNQFNVGGVQNINGWDAIDAGVGTIGLAATGLAYFGIISNPVGWAIGAGVLIYEGSRLVYDIYIEP